MRRVLALVLLAAMAASAWAEGQAEDTSEPAPRPSGASADAAADADATEAGAAAEPVPYERSEFPEWAHTLRRAEVTAIGSLPLTLFGVRVLYDYARYAAHGFDADVRPFPFRPIGGGAPLTDTETLGIVIGAVALSVVIAVIDADLRSAARGDAADR